MSDESTSARLSRLAAELATVQDERDALARQLEDAGLLTVAALAAANQRVEALEADLAILRAELESRAKRLLLTEAELATARAELERLRQADT